MAWETDLSQRKENGRTVRPLTIILLVAFMVVWTFVPQIENIFVNVIFSD